MEMKESMEVWWEKLFRSVIQTPSKQLRTQHTSCPSPLSVIHCYEAETEHPEILESNSGENGDLELQSMETLCWDPTVAQESKEEGQRGTRRCSAHQEPEH